VARLLLLLGCLVRRISSFREALVVWRLSVVVFVQHLVVQCCSIFGASLKFGARSPRVEVAAGVSAVPHQQSLVFLLCAAWRFAPPQLFSVSSIMVCGHCPLHVSGIEWCVLFCCSSASRSLPLVVNVSSLFAQVFRRVQFSFCRRFARTSLARCGVIRLPVLAKSVCALIRTHCLVQLILWL
jgi:hypothetical protein